MILFFYNEFKILLTYNTIKATNVSYNMKYVALATFAPLRHQLPLKHGKSLWKPRNMQISVICKAYAIIYI